MSCLETKQVPVSVTASSDNIAGGRRRPAAGKRLEPTDSFREGVAYVIILFRKFVVRIPFQQNNNTALPLVSLLHHQIAQAAQL